MRTSSSKKFKRPKIKLAFRLLGKKPPNGKNKTSFGLSDTRTGDVFIDPRQTDSEMLDTVIHECLHIAYPKLQEHKIHYIANMIAGVLVKMGYKRK